MKVAMYYRNDDVRIEEMPQPKIGRDELLVQMRACGICGSDVLEWYRLKTAPRVLGHEMTGEVIDVGSDVFGHSVGDRVFVAHHVPCNECHFCQQGKYTLCSKLHSTNFYPGGFAEYIRIPSINVACGTFKLPDNVSYQVGTFIEPLGCIIRGLRTACFSKNQSVLVLGSGIAGLLYIKLLRALGASVILATDISLWRLEKAKAFGADVVFDGSKDIIRQIDRYSLGFRPDLVITCTGALPAIDQALQVVKKGSTLLIFAPTKPGVVVPFPLFDLWDKQITIVSTYAAAPVDIKEAITLLSDGVVDIEDMITHRLPLDKAQQGFSLVNQAKKSIKVILENNSKH